MLDVGADRFPKPDIEYDDYEHRAVTFCRVFRAEINDYIDTVQGFKPLLEAYGLDSVEDALDTAYPTRKVWERI